jgi:hypothetical protein
MNKFTCISVIVVILLFLNKLGLTTIPSMLIMIPAYIIASIWAYLIFLATIIVVIETYNKK